LEYRYTLLCETGPCIFFVAIHLNLTSVYNYPPCAICRLWLKDGKDKEGRGNEKDKRDRVSESKKTAERGK
jgi:hypothetical protein